MVIYLWAFVKGRPGPRRAVRPLLALLLVCLGPALAGCTFRTIEGKVVDVSGEALPGVAVQVRDTPYQALTDAHGRYAIAYSPGEVVLDFMKSGYTPARLELDATGSEEIVARDVEMWRLPRDSGVYEFHEYLYEPFDNVKAERYAATDRNTILYGSKRKEVSAVSGSQPMIIAYRTPDYNVRLYRLKLLEMMHESSEQERTKIEAWVPSGAVPVTVVPIDEPERLLLHLRYDGALEPGRYAVHWGALDGETSLDSRVYLFEVPEPPDDEAGEDQDTEQTGDAAEGEDAEGEDAAPAG